jgi:serine/threonine protein kinase
LIPSTILFIASDAVDIASQMIVIDGNFCRGFYRWLKLKKCGIRIDFRRIERMGFDLPCLEDYIINLSLFSEKSMNCDSDEIGNEIYHRIEDEFSILMKSVRLSEHVEKSRIATVLEKMINLRHPCISAPIGFVFEIESGNLEDLKIFRLYFEGCSLSEVLSLNPHWFTSTVKAKAIAGIILGLRFAHSLGMLHCHLTPNNILFDSDHCIHIVDFTPMIMEFDAHYHEEMTQVVSFSGEGCTPKIDIEAFASILFELLFGRPPQDDSSIPTGIPNFVSMIFKSTFRQRSEPRYSFTDILEILKQNKFRIEDDVDSEGVSRFVSWVESAELPDQ